MSRDHRKLKVFHLADELVVKVYQATKLFPAEERYGLQSQLRRAAVSAAANLVEGCARTSTKDYLHFVTMSLASASESRYLIELAGRLGYVSAPVSDDLENQYGQLVRQLQKLTNTLQRET